MRRRTLILGATGLGAAAGLAVLGARGWLAPLNAAPKVARLGLVNFGSQPTPQAVLRARLQDHGWVEGQNLLFELRDTDPNSLDVSFGTWVPLAQELVRLPVDVIITSGSVVTQAALQTTDHIPIVFVTDDPVGLGIVTSMAHPGGHATGINSLSGSGLARKRLEWLSALVPGLSRLAFLTNLSRPIPTGAESPLRDAAGQLGVQVQVFDVRSADDLKPVFAAVAAWPADGLLLDATTPFSQVKQQVGQLALSHRLPTEVSGSIYVAPGVLGYYGTQVDDEYAIIARKVDQILHGANPGDLPVELPTRFDYVLSRSTVQALGLAIPPDIASQVTEWVQ